MASGSDHDPTASSTSTEGMPLTAPSFAVVQLPMNPFETGGIDFAKKAQTFHDLHVMTVRPLSAIDKQGVWRLVDDNDLIAPTPASQSSQSSDGAVYQLPAVERMRDARNAAFAHFDPPPPEDPENRQRTSWKLQLAFLCALVRDTDGEIGQFTSFQHYEQNIVEGILPMLMAVLKAWTKPALVCSAF